MSGRRKSNREATIQLGWDVIIKSTLYIFLLCAFIPPLGLVMTPVLFFFWSLGAGIILRGVTMTDDNKNND